KVAIAAFPTEFVIQINTRNNTEHSSESLYVGVNRYLQTIFENRLVNIHTGRDKLSGFMKEIYTINSIDCAAGRRIVYYSHRKHTAQKLNDAGVDVQA
ncbi:22014_t:CDS:2, partial [Gigaspora rosea]